MGAADAAGLCAACVNARFIESSKGSRFMRCELSFTDARFVRYPRLPVMMCAGFSTTEAAAQSLRPPGPEGSDDSTSS